MSKSITELISSCLGIKKNIPNPIQWKITAIKKSFDTYEIHMIAFIAHPWKLYAQESPSHGPSPTTIRFEENSFLSLIGKPKEIGTVNEGYEEVFNGITHYYNTAVDFVQEVRIYQSELLKGEIIYMACSEKKCLKPQVIEFQLVLS